MAPRKPLIRTADHPYHVTNRSNNAEWFYIPIEEVWHIMIYALKRVKAKEPFFIYQFVLMSNHYHLLISTPDQNIDRIMMLFSLYTTNEIRLRSHRINHVFGGRYRWSIIRNQNYLYQVVKYIYLNPVRAKIVERAENYPFSTLSYQLNLAKNFGQNFSEAAKFRDLIEDINQIFPVELPQGLDWINQSLDEKQEKNIRNGLKKLEFDLCGH